MGCMADKGDAQVCPVCDWTEGTPPDVPVQLAPRTVISEKYMVGRVLGQGGFGITYLAWDLLLSRKLAIKEYFPREICSRGRDEISVQPLTQRNQRDYEYGLAKFVEEGRNLARFRDYPGIVSLLDFFEANGTAYIVMAYMEGMTFKQYLEEQGGKVNFDQAVTILNPVMDALREVHRVGMLHRDISPDNIYLNRDRQVKILDFGATRYAMGDRSQNLTVVIKPGYAPLEQYSSGGKQGPWTDVYAVGATFYRALAGKQPSEAPDRLTNDDLVPPSRLNISIPSPSETALLKALAVHWQNRFQAMEEFQQSIVPTQPPEPHPIPPPPPPRPSPLLIAAASLFLLTTLGFAATWLSVRSELKSVQAQTQAPSAQLQAAQAQVKADEQKIQDLTRQLQDAQQNQSADSKAFAGLKQQVADLTTARNQLQGQISQLQSQLQAATTGLNTAQNERDTYKNQVNSLNEQIHSLQAQRSNSNQPAPLPRFSLTDFEFYSSDAQGRKLGTPSGRFSSNSLSYVYCQLGGAAPRPSGHLFSPSRPLNIEVKVIAPDGTQQSLHVKTKSASGGWNAFAYWGNGPGSFQRGQWTVEVWFGERIATKTFQVD